MTDTPGMHGWHNSTTHTLPRSPKNSPIYSTPLAGPNWYAQMEDHNFDRSLQSSARLTKTEQIGIYTQSRIQWPSRGSSKKSQSYRYTHTRRKSQSRRIYCSLEKHGKGRRNQPKPIKFFTDCHAKNGWSILIWPQLTSIIDQEAEHIANLEIRKLPLGAKVWIQHHETKKWDRPAIMIEIRQEDWSYFFETANCTHLLRGRRYVKLC